MSVLNTENKREIIFAMPGTEEYRVVAQFGHHYLIPENWWLYLQQRRSVKVGWFFNRRITVTWSNVDSKWYERRFRDRSELEKAATELYEDNIITPQRVVKEAMEL